MLLSPARIIDEWRRSSRAMFPIIWMMLLCIFAESLRSWYNFCSSWSPPCDSISTQWVGTYNYTRSTVIISDVWTLKLVKIYCEIIPGTRDNLFITKSFSENSLKTWFTFSDIYVLRQWTNKKYISLLILKTELGNNDILREWIWPPF